MRSARFVEIPSDHLEPEVRRRDFVLLVDVDRYIGEGLYFVRNSFGKADSYYCDAAGNCRHARVRMKIPNRLYRSAGEDVDLDDFNCLVVGKVAMTCKVLDHSLIEQISGLG